MTTVWAIWEAGFDFFLLAPRFDIIVLFALWLLLPLTMRSFPENSRPGRRVLGVAVALPILSMAISLFFNHHDIEGKSPETVENSVPQWDAQNIPDAEWHAYGRTLYGDHSSPLKHINSQNVNQLKVVWTFHPNDIIGKDDPLESTFEVTPLKVGNRVYLCSPHQWVFALDAATGKQVWKFDPKV